MNGVNYRYGKAARSAPDRVSCKFHANEAAAVVGLAGSGKTTLLSIIAGLYRTTHGERYLVNRWFGRMDLNECCRRYVFAIFQAFHQFSL